MDAHTIYKNIMPSAEALRSILQSTASKLGPNHRLGSTDSQAYARAFDELKAQLAAFNDRTDILDDLGLPSRLELANRRLGSDRPVGSRHCERLLSLVDDLVDNLLAYVRHPIAIDEYAWVPRDRPGRPAPAIRDAIKVLESTCLRIAASYDVKPDDRIVYEEFWDKITLESPDHLPGFLEEYPKADRFHQVFGAPSFPEQIRAQIGSAFSKFADHEARRTDKEDAAAGFNEDAFPPRRDIEAPTSEPGDGRSVQPTVTRRIAMIKRFAPVALEAIDGLIELHERLLHNQSPEPEQLQALDLLRHLHREIGALLAAVEEGRPIVARTRRLHRLRSGVFRFAGDTGELIVASSPAIAASVSLAFAAMMALDLICGVPVGTGEAAISVGLTGTIVGGHSVAKASKRRASKPSRGSAPR